MIVPLQNHFNLFGIKLWHESNPPVTPRLDKQTNVNAFSADDMCDQPQIITVDTHWLSQQPGKKLLLSRFNIYKDVVLPV